VASEFKGDSAATKEASKILRRQIDKALDSLKKQRISDVRIHRARKQIKMARATVRLLRSGLSGKQYRHANNELRDAARPLSEARDSTVLRVTFDHLLNEVRGRGVGNDGRAVGRMLARNQTQAHRRIAGPHELPHARQLLRKVRTLASHWRAGHRGWSVIGKGLSRVYGDGRDALYSALETRTDDAFHAWRKQVKYLRHQLRLLQPIWPGPIEALVQELHALSDALGDDHDLAVLRGQLAARNAPFQDEGGRQRLLAQLDGRRASLQRKALRLGARMYEEPADQFCTRLGQYWRDWRHA
jgi:CHAD domain-containing protein